MKNNENEVLKNYKFEKRVYYVASKEDDTVVLAIDPKIRDGYLYWFDTVRERIKPIDEVMAAEDREFTFRSDGSVTYTFLPLTIELYEKFVKSHLVAPEGYRDEEDLINKIIHTIDSAW
ncbi:MAG: hypothetical protein HY225_03635 [Candidatus Vogelbacteria bacterium]|nr:hypothetical protein [Candidatus Vogelbacteria bacterium]